MHIEDNQQITEMLTDIAKRLLAAVAELLKTAETATIRVHPELCAHQTILIMNWVKQYAVVFHNN